MNHTISTAKPAAMPREIYVMVAAAGLGAANLHYSQPLLPTIANTFGVDVATIGLLPALTQLGFALGIFLILPLADLLERRRLILTLLIIVALSLLLHAVAWTPGILLAAGFLVGLAGVVPQLLTPFASLLAAPGRAGAAVGLVLSGILTGVLLSKVLAGVVTGGLGWRDLYLAAAIAMLGLAVVLRIILPQSRAEQRLTYIALMATTVRLTKSSRRLRRHALNGGLTFAMFMTFWGTYAIELQERFGYGPTIAGFFGAAGLMGAMGASFAGRLIDRGQFRQTLMLSVALMIAGFCLLLFSSASIVFMVIGLLMLDAGAGFSHAANQTEAFKLDPTARGRINGIYMTGYFLGGAIGTSIATYLVTSAGWWAVCTFGLTCGALMLLMEMVRPLLTLPGGGK
jgi:predicted MFS family arabinose efflux permease